ncbi:MAG: toll/interleukin-1 receptor domain-containing protein [Vicinamibacterales bacterium]
MNEIFLSYASADRARVEPLVKALEAEKLQVWWDRDIECGQNFNQMIEQALTAARCVIVVWTRSSLQSEWVLNEASDARRRGRLLPVLFESVTPPLQFRHLQTADLSGWTGDPADPQFTGFRRGVLTMLGKSEASSCAALVARPARRWWQTRSGQALGAGGLVFGLLMLLAVKLAIVGSRVQPLDGTSVTAIPFSRVGASAGSSDGPPSAPGASAIEPVNLLDTASGARLLYTNGGLFAEHWKTLFTGSRAMAMVGLGDFAVLAVRGEGAVRFDTIAVFVEGLYAAFGVKELALYTSSASPEGPFVKTAQITVPDHPIAQEPFQEFHFAPVQARFVKLQVLSSHREPAYLGPIQLYADTTSNTF